MDISNYTKTEDSNGVITLTPRPRYNSSHLNKIGTYEDLNLLNFRMGGSQRWLMVGSGTLYTWLAFRDEKGPTILRDSGGGTFSSLEAALDYADTNYNISCY